MTEKRRLSVKELRETVSRVRKGEFPYKDKEQKTSILHITTKPK
jgi:hypothetical protein